MTDMKGRCRWPEGHCACAMVQAAKPDPHGRIWMHVEQGLTLSKASMGRLVAFCLGNNIHIEQLHAFAPKYSNSTVEAVVRIHPSLFGEFEAKTGGKLRHPPKIKLN